MITQARTHHAEQRSAQCGSQANQSPVSVKLYWDAATPTCSHIVCVADLRSCRNCMAYKAECLLPGSLQKVCQTWSRKMSNTPETVQQAFWSLLEEIIWSQTLWLLNECTIKFPLFLPLVSCLYLIWNIYHHFAQNRGHSLIPLIFTKLLQMW